MLGFFYIVLTDVGDAPCEFEQTNPAISLLGPDGNPVDMKVFDTHWTRFFNYTEPTFTIQPQGSAYAVVRFYGLSEWWDGVCTAGNISTLRVPVPGVQGDVDINITDIQVCDEHDVMIDAFAPERVPAEWIGP